MSGGTNTHVAAFTGAAADITLYPPFKPGVIRFTVASGGALIHGLKTYLMSGAAYLSTSTGVDAGVTINSDGSVLVANGADVNVNGGTVHVVFEDNFQD